MLLNAIGLKVILETGAHIGSKTSRRNLGMGRYVLRTENEYDIIDPRETVAALGRLHDLAREHARKGAKTVVYAGRGKMANVIKEAIPAGCEGVSVELPRRLAAPRTGQAAQEPGITLVAGTFGTGTAGYLRKLSGEQSLVVGLLDTCDNPDGFDLVVPFNYERYTALTMALGALAETVNEYWLEAGTEEGLAQEEPKDGQPTQSEAAPGALPQQPSPSGLAPEPASSPSPKEAPNRVAADSPEQAPPAALRPLEALKPALQPQHVQSEAPSSAHYATAIPAAGATGGPAEKSLTAADIKRVLAAAGVKSLYHYNTVATACTYLAQGGIMSRGAVQRAALLQTPQRSDHMDKRLGVWDDIFFDTVNSIGVEDLPYQFLYGSVLFEYSLDALDDERFAIRVARKNPVNWEDEGLQTDAERFLGSVADLQDVFLKAGRRGGSIKSHIMFRSLDKLDFQHLKRIVFYHPPELDELGQMAFNAICLAAHQAGLDNKIFHLGVPDRHFADVTPHQRFLFFHPEGRDPYYTGPFPTRFPYGAWQVTDRVALPGAGSEKATFSATWCGHVLTDDELNRLLARQVVSVRVKGHEERIRLEKAGKYWDLQRLEE